MIYFYRPKKSARCDEIQEKLSDMVIAHKTVTPPIGGMANPGGFYAAPLPLMIDGKKIVHGEENIWQYTQKLEKIKDKWDRFQGDSCYCGDDDSIE